MTAPVPSSKAAVRTGLGVRSVGAVLVGATVATSAFLLFWAEPLVGRLIVPIFGGTPGVWATALCFFQAVLLLGYLYAHLSTEHLRRRSGVAFHALLVGLAIASLAFGQWRVADLPATGVEPVDVLLILLVAIGVPTFVLTATTPLVSGWATTAVEASGHGQGPSSDPYRLYALSNAGSLAALVLAPLVIDPNLGLSGQKALWSATFLAFAALIVACGRWAIANGWSAPRPTAVDAVRPRGTDRPDVRRRLRWLLLAAVPSGLLSAVTNFIATDLVSAPLLWVIPLGIYLASFIVVFTERGRRLVRPAILVAPAAITLMWVPLGSAGGWPILPLLLIAYGGLAIVATALHGRLALDRPVASELTAYYLVIATGGVLASAFVAILAPLLFPDVWEYPVLLVGAVVALAVPTPHADSPTDAEAGSAMTDRRNRRFDPRPFIEGAGPRVVPYLVAAVLLTVMLVRDDSLASQAAIRWLVVGGLVLLVGARPGFFAVSTALVLALATFVLQPTAILRERSFYGVSEVLRPAGATQTVLMNGTTVHGQQSTDPRLAAIPEAYYAPSGPFGDLMKVLGADGRPHRVAVVGLGSGALATYLRPGWQMTYFEIDPLVVRIAEDPRYFSYLSDAATAPAIVIGDARRSLREVPDDAFDAVIVDAFSSDSIPGHLLTAEAMAQYVRIVAPGGLVAVHISNRYYDLAPAVAGAAQDSGLAAFRRQYAPSATDAAGGAWPTDLVVASSSPTIGAALAGDGWRPLAATVRPMTDDFPDTLRFLRPLF